MKQQIILHPSTGLQLELLLASDNLNSIGIYGAPGSGKKYLASHIVKQIFSIDEPKQYPYIKTIDAFDDGGIDAVRELKTFLRLKVPGSKRFNRAIVINNIEAFGIPAQNAMLKTLEEPPVGTVILITTSNKSSLLPTIDSRLHWIYARPASKQQLKDSFGLPDSELEKALFASGGNVASFIKALDGEQKQNHAIEQAKFLLKASRFEKLANVDSVIKDESYSIDELLESMAKILRAVLAKDTGQTKHTQSLVDKLDKIMLAKDRLKYKPSAKLLLTSLFNSI